MGISMEDKDHTHYSPVKKERKQNLSQSSSLANYLSSRERHLLYTK
jgi:hypothetical protein